MTDQTVIVVVCTQDGIADEELVVAVVETDEQANIAIEDLIDNSTDALCSLDFKKCVLKVGIAHIKERKLKALMSELRQANAVVDKIKAKYDEVKNS